MQLKLKDGKPIFKQGWITLGGKTHYMRSEWEYFYAIHLQKLKQQGKIADWFYEPVTFWFLKIMRGVRSYKPDFKVLFHSGNEEFVEVKGFMDDQSKTKINRMRIYYPKVKLRVVEREWFRRKGFIK
jgi:hypothetical protein